MEDEKRLYGRKRVRKTKPIIPAEPTKPEESGDTDASIENSDTLSQTVIDFREVSKPDRAAKNQRVAFNHDRKSAVKKPDRVTRQPERQRGKPYTGSKYSQPKRKPDARSRVRISVIIPAYNEEDNIKPLMEQFNDVIRKTGRDWEVILVDDGSTDKTAERARLASRTYPWLKVIGYRQNRGLTAALNVGFKNARGSILVFYPADMQYHAQDIRGMIARIDRGADLVTGWKEGKYDKRLISYVYNKLCRMLFGLKVHDLNSTKAFRKEVVKEMVLRRDWHRYMVVFAAEEGFVIDEVKVKIYPRRFGKSKFGIGRILGGLLDLFSVKFQISFMRKPLRFFGFWGILSGVTGFVVGLIALYLRFFTSHGSRTLLYLVILLVLSGLMLFALGFLAEVLVSLREEIESMKSK